VRLKCGQGRTTRTTEIHGGLHSRRRGSEIMEGGALKVLILAGRLNWDDGGWPLTPLLDRLERRDCHVQVLCLSRGNDLLDDKRAVEVPALANRWLRTFAARGLWSHGHLVRPDLLHVLHDEMGDAALALSETASLPYVQTVSRFGTVDRGLRLSRRWCRRLVATSPDLAHELIEELGVPGDRLVVIRPGMALYPPTSPKTGAGKVPVIGTGGPLEEASGMMVFLDAARLVMDAGHDVEFVIVSQGTQQIVLRHRAQHLQIADRVTVADYPTVGAGFWGVLDIYCQPAVVASAGRTLIQAFGHAVPCIAANVKGLRALIEAGENGLIVPPGDARALEQAMIALLDNPEGARTLGNHALDRARALFDPDVEADRLIDLYRQASGSSSHWNGTFS
jgi:glycosyltransferase involved in cell wall biosynthesis